MRLLPPFPLRPAIPLDGLWDFRHAVDEREPDGPARRLPVPGVWETDPALYRHRGCGWYRRTFSVPGGAPAAVRLVFAAVSQAAQVSVDGRVVAEHYGGHTAFAAVLPDLAAGAHELCVRADNRYGPANPLVKPSQDIYCWGGIPRSVHAEILPAVAIAEISALPRQERGRWLLDVAVRLERHGAEPLPAQVEVALDGRRLGTVAIGSDGRGAAALAVKGVQPWSPASPRLYTVQVDVAGADVPLDRWQARVGFRTIACRGRQLLLNGEPLTLCGVNRHEFHPDWGPALPPALHLRDIHLLKELGANFVRGSHYPNDELFLDLCDEHGLLVWDETSHWQPSADDLADAQFRQRTLEQIDELVGQHGQHPSVILWGMINEAATEAPGARAAIRLFARRFKERDASRPVTYASHKPDLDTGWDVPEVDVVSVNAYPGWYGGDLCDLDERLATLFATMRTRSHGKPLILSEFGGAAMDGVRSFEVRKWTEGYQAELLRRIITAVQDGGLISGVAIWQFCDVRTSPQLAMGRIREYNNKGILTEWREPKLAWHVVREVFAREWKAPGAKRTAKGAKGGR